GCGPGVSSLLCGKAVAPMKMTPDVARRNFERPNCRYKNVGKILANATADRKSLPRCGSGVGGISIEGHFAIERSQDRMQKRQRIAIGAGARCLREFHDRGVALRQRCFAHVELRRK